MKKLLQIWKILKIAERIYRKTKYDEKKLNFNFGSSV